MIPSTIISATADLLAALPTAPLVISPPLALLGSALLALAIWLALRRD